VCNIFADDIQAALKRYERRPDSLDRGGLLSYEDCSGFEIPQTINYYAISLSRQTYDETIIDVTSMCRVLRGEITGIARDLLVSARLNMVPKDDNKYRPICIECAVCKHFGATASDIARKAVGPGLHPIQTGGSLRCGVEFDARIADIAFRQQHAIIAVDIANAFNTVRHHPIFDAIMERCQPMARLFRWKYGTPSEMRDHSGIIVAHTRTGVGQGDRSRGMYYFKN
jgi:hypothetical protein